ncbi:MAG: hypothetical protein KH230_20345 [Enterocloster asparagiformis]|nr:hypothetical protein [Enterocloster asparagiformis]
MGITGIWEGYVPTSTDLYIRGNNAANFTANFNISFESGGILNTGNGMPILTSGKSYNYSGYKYLKTQIYITRLTLTASNTYSSRIKVVAHRKNASESIIGTGQANNVTVGSTYTITTSLTNASFTSPIIIKIPHYRINNVNEEVGPQGWEGYVYRIWIE